MEIRSSKLFLGLGVTFAVLALIVGVMMWFGQAALQAERQAKQQAEQTEPNRAEQRASAFPRNTKEAAVEHCRAVAGINDWLGCMEREGVNMRRLLKIEQ